MNSASIVVALDPEKAGEYVRNEEGRIVVTELGWERFLILLFNAIQGEGIDIDDVLIETLSVRPLFFDSKEEYYIIEIKIREGAYVYA